MNKTFLDIDFEEYNICVHLQIFKDKNEALNDLKKFEGKLDTAKSKEIMRDVYSLNNNSYMIIENEYFNYAVVLSSWDEYLLLCTECFYSFDAKHGKYYYRIKYPAKMIYTFMNKYNPIHKSELSLSDKTTYLLNNNKYLVVYHSKNKPDMIFNCFIIPTYDDLFIDEFIPTLKNDNNDTKKELKKILFIQNQTTTQTSILSVEELLSIDKDIEVYSSKNLDKSFRQEKVYKTKKGYWVEFGEDLFCNIKTLEEVVSYFKSRKIYETKYKELDIYKQYNINIDTKEESERFKQLTNNLSKGLNEFESLDKIFSSYLIDDYFMLKYFNVFVNEIGNIIIKTYGGNWETQISDLNQKRVFIRLSDGYSVDFIPSLCKILDESKYEKNFYFNTKDFIDALVYHK